MHTTGSFSPSGFAQIPLQRLLKPRKYFNIKTREVCVPRHHNTDLHGSTLQRNCDHSGSTTEALPTPRFPNRGTALSGQDTEGPRLCQGLLTQTVACVPVSTQFSLGFGWEVTRVLFFNVICQLIRIILEIIEKRERHKIHIRKLKIHSTWSFIP